MKNTPASPNPARVTITGTIARVFYSTPTFTAGVISLTDGTSCNFNIKGHIQAGQSVSLVGAWGNHEKYGRQFEAETLQLDLPVSVDGLARFLSEHPAAKGIGKVKGRIIAEQYAENFEAILLNNPDEIAELHGLSVEMVKNLAAAWESTKAINGVAIWLSAFGLTWRQVNSIVDELGNNAKAILEENPYLLIGHIPGFGFKKVDAIALKMGTEKTNPNRVAAGLVYTVKEHLDDGHTWIDREFLKRIALDVLAIDSLDAGDIINNRIGILESENKLICVTHDDDKRGLVAMPWPYKNEIYCIDWFTRRRGGKSVIRSILSDELKRISSPDSNSKLNEKQREAVASAFTNQISLITGGAGVGKTFTVAEIVRLANMSGKLIALCAPTGKAAKRMSETISENLGITCPSSTIHRLLAYEHGSGFTHNEYHTLPASMVIVDECSMIDVELFAALLCAIPNNCNVVLVGDHNQLPPIGAGNILRDLIRRQGIPTVELTQVMRQAGVLKIRSQEILEGIVGESIKDGEEIEPKHRTKWIVADKFYEAASAASFIASLYRDTLSERFGYTGSRIVSDVQLLTPTHKGPLGTVALNYQIQRIVQASVYGVEIAARDPDKEPPKFYRGDKVIWMQNDYKLEIMNGTIGYVVDIHDGDDANNVEKKESGIEISFDGEIRFIPSNKKSLLSLAYAMTIHKSQGSEFPAVIVVCHKDHSYQHHRNLLYTAVTRAKRDLILVGDKWGTKNCAAREQVDTRNTFMSFMLSPFEKEANP